MRKNFILFAVLMLIASITIAQPSARRIPAGKQKPVSSFRMLDQTRTVSKTAKSVGDTITNFPWTEDFESGVAPAGFSFVDSDNDTYGWEVNDFGTTGNGHNGSDYVIASASYDNTAGVLTPDNWMMLPAFEIPAGSDFELSWYEKGQDADYAEEYYSVYINTTGNTVNDFTTTTPVLTSTSTGNWVKKTVSLSSYAGQTIFIAFRHHNVSDMFWLDIDDFRIGGEEPPEITIAGPLNVRAGDTAVFTASSTATVTWDITADYFAADAETAYAMWNTAGTYNVIASVTNTAGTNSDTMVVTVVECSAISTFPHTESFETGIPCWRVISMNTTNDYGVIESDNAYDGDYMFMFSSYETADDYNQYLITPELTLPSTGQFMLRFKYLADSESESFSILTSTTTDDVEAFTTEIIAVPSTVEDEWTDAAFEIPNNTKYIAINYYGDWAYYLYIDDLYIGGLTAPEVSLEGPSDFGTGNPCTFNAISSLGQTFAWTVDGTTVAETGNTLTHTFTTVGLHTVSVTATNSIGTSDAATLSVNVFDCGNITPPYYPDFSNGLRGWTSESDSAGASGWIASVDAFESNPDGQVLSMSAESFFGMFMVDLPTDNWLISPSITMPSTGSYEIAWKVKPFDTEYAGDHYAVYVIEDNGNQTVLHEETLNAGMTNYVQRAATIPSSVQGDFRVAFRHFNCEDGYVIILDGISIVVAGTTGIADIDNADIALYPNPASDRIIVEGKGIVEVEVLDLNGRKMLSVSNSGAIDISTLETGLYFARIVTVNGVTTKKFVKK